MASYSVHYKFSQLFDFPPQAAYKWCTDFQTGDVVLMGKKGDRQIRRINEDTLVLDDTYFGEGGKTVKKRLIRLYPERLAWTNTRISAEGKFSQFLYEIFPDGENGSRLDFTGSQIFYSSDKPSAAKIASISDELRNEDAAGWKLLAEAMKKDLYKPGPAQS